MSKSKRRHKAGSGTMEATLSWLQANRIDCEVMTEHHIKICPVNFWPITGTITVDGEGQRRNERGLDGLEATLIAEGQV